MERYMIVLKSLKRMAPELEEILRENFKPMTLEKGEILQQPATLNDKLYFIEKGLLHMYLPKGKRKITLEFRREDQFALTLDAIFGQGKGDGIEALEDCLLWWLPGKLAHELADKYHHFSLQYHDILARHMIMAQAFLRCSNPAAGPENFDYFRSEFPELVHRVPNCYLASLTEIPEKKLKHLLESPIKLNVGYTRTHRTPQ